MESPLRIKGDKPNLKQGFRCIAFAEVSLHVGSNFTPETGGRPPEIRL